VKELLAFVPSSLLVVERTEQWIREEQTPRNGHEFLLFVDAECELRQRGVLLILNGDNDRLDEDSKILQFRFRLLHDT